MPVEQAIITSTEALAAYPDLADSLDLTALVAAANAATLGVLNRTVIVQDTVVDDLRGLGGACLWTSEYPLISLVSATEDDEEIDLDDLLILGRNRREIQRTDQPFGLGTRVQLTYIAGYLSGLIPSDLKRLALGVLRSLARGSGAGQLTGDVRRERLNGYEIEFQSASAAASAATQAAALVLPPDLEMLARPYRRNRQEVR